MQRSKQYALMFLLGSLLTGAVMGFAAARMVRPDAPAASTPSFRAQVSEALALTPDQRGRFDSILDQRNEHMRRAMAPVQPELDSLKNHAREQIRLMLTPAQREKFEAYLAQQERERAGSKAPTPPPPAATPTGARQ